MISTCYAARKHQVRQTASALVAAWRGGVSPPLQGVRGTRTLRVIRHPRPPRPMAPSLEEIAPPRPERHGLHLGVDVDAFGEVELLPRFARQAREEAGA